MAQTKAVAKTATKATVKKAEPQESGHELIRMALDKDLDVEKLEKLIELKNREDDRAAKRDFDQHFAAMQAELSPALKNRVAYDRDGKIMYKYADIQSIQKSIGGTLTEHGFSYRWSEERLDVQPPEKRVWCIVSGWGWEERNYVDIPIEEAGKMNSKSHMRGGALTYGKRYSLCAAVGVVIEDDDDAQPSENTEKHEEAVEKIKAAESLDELKAVFTELYKAMAGDEQGRRKITDAKNERKRELTTDPDPETPKNPVERVKALEEEAKAEEENGEPDIY